MGFFKIFSGNRKESDEYKLSETPAMEVPVGKVIAGTVTAGTGDSELAAVIAAAIAAFESGSASSSLIVRKINRASGPALAWNAAGRAELIDSRRI